MAFKQADKSEEALNAPVDGEADGEGNTDAVSRVRTEEVVYPSGIKLSLLMLSSFVSVFLVALDRLIIATAIPQITDDFHSVTNIGWYGSAYMLTNCAFQLSFGKLYTLYSVKFVFLTAIALFEVGSATCGAAPNSVVFIVGRAISGLGSAGIFSGVLTVIAYSLPLHRRPLFQGLFGTVFGTASVIGPLLGGAFTTNVSWRWCFYINLPFGAVAMLAIFFLLQVPDRETTHLPIRQKLAQLDILGLAAFLPSIVCLLVALEWGGSTYAWSNGRVIALLVLSPVLLIAFIAIQIFKSETATLPPRIFCQRSIMSGFFATLLTGSSQMIVLYYLPIWFQAIKGDSAVDSGIKLLPMVLPMAFGSMSSGFLITKIGYYMPFMIFGPIPMSIGAGLLTTLQVKTGTAKWVGYQILYGYGTGNIFQGPNLAAQTVLPLHDIPLGTALMLFAQLLGGAIFTSVGQNILNSELLKRLSGFAGFDTSKILSSGATTITDLPEPLRNTVLVAYNEALRRVFQVALVITCLVILPTVCMEWRSVKRNMPGNKAAETVAEDGQAQTTIEMARFEKDDASDKLLTEPRRHSETTGTVHSEETRLGTGNETLEAVD